MATERDYYETLGIPRDSDLKTIKDAYHRLAMKWHPDRNKSPDAEERFKEIAKAYAVLSDPNKRARYDARGFEGIAHFTPDDLYANIDLGSLFGDLGFGFGPGGDSIFDRFFGVGSSRRSRDRDLRINMELPLKRIAKGGKETIHYSRPVTCSRCHGYGTASGKPPKNCASCDGSGHQIKTQKAAKEKQGHISFQQVITCPDCHGRGSVPEKPCKTCGGDGQTTKQEKLVVNIPAGIEDGMILRIPGHGSSGKPGIEPGDLHILITTSPDPAFQRRGADLWRTATIQIADAVLGTTLQVPTLDGEVEVKVPPGTQTDEILKLKGKGLPHFGNNGRGAINLRLHIQIPSTLSGKQRKLFEQLRDLDT